MLNHVCEKGLLLLLLSLLCQVEMFVVKKVYESDLEWFTHYEILRKQNNIINTGWRYI